MLTSRLCLCYFNSEGRHAEVFFYLHEMKNAELFLKMEETFIKISGRDTKFQKPFLYFQKLLREEAIINLKKQ